MEYDLIAILVREFYRWKSNIHAKVQLLTIVLYSGKIGACVTIRSWGEGRGSSKRNSVCMQEHVPWLMAGIRVRASAWQVIE